MSDFVTSTFAKLNTDAITAAIVAVDPGERQVPDFDIVTIKKMIWAACQVWLERDLDTFVPATVKVEQLTEIPFEDVAVDDPGAMLCRTKGFIDLSAMDSGMRLVAYDWKTAKTLDYRWDERHAESWQWKMYCHALFADGFQYRGIEKAPDENGQYVCRELNLRPSLTNSEEVREYVRGAWLSRQALIDARLEVWPRHMPHACMAYGRRCEYWDDCRKYEKIPRQAVAQKDLSYSEIEKFMLCNERDRRGVIHIEGAAVSDTDETNLGKAFHRGIAEVYRQVFVDAEKGGRNG